MDTNRNDIQNIEEISSQQSFIDKFVVTISLTSKRILLNLKSFATNPMTLILLFVVPTLFCLSTVVILSVGYNLGIIITSIIVLIELVTYGTVAGAFRRSTLNMNTNLTVGVRWIDNLATIGTMFIMGVVMLTYVLIVLTMLDAFGVMLFTPTTRSSEYSYLFISVINVSIIYYYTIVLTLLTYSISYFFQGFFDSDMMFFTLGLLIFIILALFGATLNDYFHIVSLPPKEGDIRTIIEFKHGAPLGDGGFIPSLLFPFYIPTQVIKMNGNIIVHPELDANVLWTWIDQGSEYYLDAAAWKWNIMWFFPYFNIVFWWVLGFLYKYFIK